MTQTVLVTGATGFVGSAVARALLDRGLVVRCTGRSDPDRVDFPEYVPADLGEVAAFDRLLRGVRCVVHVAGLAHQHRGGSRERFTHVNADIPARLVSAAVRCGVEHLVLVSSVSVYGETRRSGSVDEGARCSPATEYGRSKRLGERRVLEAARGQDLRVTVLRLATVYGEGDPGNVRRLIEAIRRNRFVWIGEGENRKSLIHRDDVARACVEVVESPVDRAVDSALENGRSSPEIHEIFNLVGETVTVREILQAIYDALERRPPSWRVPASLASLGARALSRVAFGSDRLKQIHPTVRRWLAEDSYDGSKFARRFRFRSAVGLREGIEREVDWWLGKQGPRELREMVSTDPCFIRVPSAAPDAFAGLEASVVPEEPRKDPSTRAP